MAEAIFGLIGVLVGALVTGGFELFLQRRRESREFRRSARLVRGELRTVLTHLDALTRERVLPATLTADRLLPSAEWEQHKSHLGEALPDDLWDELEPLYERVEELRILVGQRPPGASIRPEELPEALELAERAAEVRGRLGRL